MTQDTVTPQLQSPPPSPGVPGRARQAYTGGSPEQLIRSHAPLVRRLALQLMARLPASVELDDLVQAGMMGLMDAARRYQALPTAQFETYAVQRIRGAMLDELRQLDWMPRGVRDKSRRIEQAIHQLTKTLTRPPTEAEIAQYLELDTAGYHQLLLEAQGAQLVSYDELGDVAKLADEGLLPLLTRDDADPLALLDARQMRSRLVQAIEALPEREQLLLSLYYVEDLNLKEIGLVLGVGEARVSQLRTQAISRLRASMHGPDPSR